MCRCLEWPQAVSGFLKSAATLTNRSGEGASRCALRATSSKHGPRGPEAVVGSGDESPRRDEIKLRPVRRACQASQSPASQSPITRERVTRHRCSNSCSCSQSRLKETTPGVFVLASHGNSDLELNALRDARNYRPSTTSDVRARGAVVTLMFASWNQMAAWLRAVDSARHAA